MKSELRQLHDKLDNNYDLTYEVRGNVQAIEQHLANLNGSVKRHEEEFKKVYSNFEKQQKSNGAHFVLVEDRLKRSEDNWVKGQGVVLALSIGASIIVTSIGVLVALSNLGMLKI